MFMKEIFSVTELNDRIRNLLENHFDILWVEGEISNLRRPSSGHLYFTLKDESSQIRAVIFKYSNMKNMMTPKAFRFELEDGMKVICCARLSVYQPRGEYQLVIEIVEPKGLGALQKAFEQLKAKLKEEGLFDSVHKKPIPFLPNRIAIITSLTGAVIKDILNITARRFPSVDILIAPVRVQGTEASAEIEMAISDIHEVGNVDVIIIARGGGSLEDLAPFNNELVARAIFRSQIPIISAIGHEIDYTIADFVADLRAPTPSAAAEMVVPVKKDLIASIRMLRERLANQHRIIIEKLKDRVAYLEGKLKYPRKIINDYRMTVDYRTERLRSLLEHRLALVKTELMRTRISLKSTKLLGTIRENRLIIENLKKNIIAECKSLMRNQRGLLDSYLVMLDALSPLSVLKRGYSIVKKIPEGAIIRDAASLSVDSKVSVKASSGSFHAKVTDIYKE